MQLVSMTILELHDIIDGIEASVLTTLDYLNRS